jgi:uncharacterized protein (DUF2267 family)
VDAEHFLDLVRDAVATTRDGAERATRATLQTLGERITAGEARDLATQLPPEIAPWLAPTGAAEPFDVDEFLARVARREGTDLATAERHAAAVFTALGQAVAGDELDDVAAQLPADYAALLPRGPDVEVMPAERFWERIAECADLDLEGARRAADAVLETLAERIAGGEVDDLRARLPAALHAPLRRGREHGDGRARAMSLEEFLRRVAEREGVDLPRARAHARAVFHVLREAVGDDEFFDVTAELPGRYASALAFG